MHAKLSSGAKSLKFGLRFHLGSFLVFASSEDSGQTAQMRSLFDKCLQVPKSHELAPGLYIHYIGSNRDEEL